MRHLALTLALAAAWDLLVVPAHAEVPPAVAPAPTVNVPDPPLAEEPDAVAPTKDDSVARRAALMADDLEAEVHVADALTSGRAFGLIFGGLLSGFAVYGAATSDERSLYAWWGAAGAVRVLGAGATFVVNDDYRQPLLNSSFLIGSGLFVMGIGQVHGSAGDEQRALFSPYAIGGISGALVVSGGLDLLGAALQRPVSFSTLAADYELVGSAADRSKLTAEQLACIEAHFRRSASPLPRWVLAMPSFVGGAVAGGAAIFDERGSTLGRSLEGVGGALLVGAGMLTLFPQSGYWHYEKLVRKNGLSTSVSVLPGGGAGVQLSGGF